MSFAALVRKDDRGQVHSFKGLLPVERMTPLFGAFDDEGVPDQVDGVWGNGTLLQTSKPTAYVLKAGELMRVFAASGGGYGDPLKRPAETVLYDVRNDFTTVEQAAEIYGVKVDPEKLTLDEAATATLRERLAGERGEDFEPPLSHPREWPRTQVEFEEMRKRALGAPAAVEV
jgi:hypothetical protein